MILVHDYIKIKYTREGYLPDYPYHMISDEEMIEAFMKSDSDEGFFFDNYYVKDESLKEQYETLVQTIRFHIDIFKKSKDDTRVLPDWVYSYMLGSVISEHSSDIDRHDLLVLLDLDNVDDNFTEQAKKRCLSISKQWIKKITEENRYVKILNPNGTYSRYDGRPATMFGESHVIKSLRLDSAGV